MVCMSRSEKIFEASQDWNSTEIKTVRDAAFCLALHDLLSFSSYIAHTTFQQLTRPFYINLENTHLELPMQQSVEKSQFRSPLFSTQ